jgi:hypothetical protein
MATYFLVGVAVCLMLSAIVAANVQLQTNRSLPSLVEVIADQEGVSLPDLNGYFGEPTSWACGSLLQPRSLSVNELIERVPVCDAQMSQQGSLVTGLAVSGIGILGLALWARRSAARSETTHSVARPRRVPPRVRAGSLGPNDGTPGAFDQFERLAGLYERGIISAAEFQSKKSELLDRL